MTESESHPRQTLGPFLAALALIVVLVVIIAVLNAIGVFGRNDPTPEQLVRTHQPPAAGWGCVESRHLPRLR